MSLQSRKELLAFVQKRYQQASWFGKRKILDELVATTNYRHFTNRQSVICQNIMLKKKKNIWVKLGDKVV